MAGGRPSRIPTCHVGLFKQPPDVSAHYEVNALVAEGASCMQHIADANCFIMVSQFVWLMSPGIVKHGEGGLTCPFERVSLNLGHVDGRRTRQQLP